MLNRRIFFRASCTIPVVIQATGKFLYGELTELSLGGCRIRLKEAIPGTRVELTPHRTNLDRASIIPLPYEVCWSIQGDGYLAGLQFSGGVDAFFRGWLADRLQTALPGQELMLEQRQAVRFGCQLAGVLRSEEGAEIACTVLELSVAGARVTCSEEVVPGESFYLRVAAHPRLDSLDVIVLRAQDGADPGSFGVRFLAPTEDQADALRELVSGFTKGASTSCPEI